MTLSCRICDSLMLPGACPVIFTILQGTTARGWCGCVVQVRGMRAAGAGSGSSNRCRMSPSQERGEPRLTLRCRICDILRLRLPFHNGDRSRRTGCVRSTTDRFLLRLWTTRTIPGQNQSRIFNFSIFSPGASWTIPQPRRPASDALNRRDLELKRCPDGGSGHMVVAKPDVSQRLSRFYCHVEENICEAARYDCAFACSENRHSWRETNFQFICQASRLTAA